MLFICRSAFAMVVYHYLTKSKRIYQNYHHYYLPHTRTYALEFSKARKIFVALKEGTHTSGSVQTETERDHRFIDVHTDTVPALKKFV